MRLQFIPKNPYTRSALNFTFCHQVQLKIQRRQLRATHPDNYYCDAQFKYFKSKALEKKDHVVGFYSDDKSKIHVKEPNTPVSTGGRGRESITPKSVTFEALDHDMHRSSLTPNVALWCDIPASTDKFFVKGNVYYTASDSVFQSSSPFRHGRMLCKIVKELEHVPPTLMKYTNGGADRGDTLESVKVASIFC